MVTSIEKWNTQIRKGYLELCILALVQAKGRIYGFEMIEVLTQENLPIKEGTLYPLLNRMTLDKSLNASWDTQNLKGHPRKYYSISSDGEKALNEMRLEFTRMHTVLKRLEKQKPTRKLETV